jgi:tetratricopeptide (TPR) repeat protein
MNQQPTLKNRCGRILVLTVVLGACGLVFAQQPAEQQKQQPAKPPAQSNPFPEDTTNVPVIPTGNAPTAAPTNTPPPVMPSGGPDDPVRSPDDPVGNPEADSGFSSSTSGLDKIQPSPDEDAPRQRHRLPKPNASEPHQETAKEDEDVGGLYLSQKNWRAAQSRYESAVVLDPENPDVYWGLAESQRHLGQFAAAKANYEKVMEYDPDSKHAKEAKKLLTGPEMANAAAAPGPR